MYVLVMWEYVLGWGELEEKGKVQRPFFRFVVYILRTPRASSTGRYGKLGEGGREREDIKILR